MAFLRTSAEITGGTIENVSFTSPTLVDMALTCIRNTGDPVRSTDAANKRFVEDYTTQRVRMIETTIQGNTNSIAIDDRLFGAFHVSVTGRVEGNPLGIFLVSKSTRTVPVAVHTITTWRGSQGSEIVVTWPDNLGIHLNKTGTGDDGIYLVKII